MGILSFLFSGGDFAISDKELLVRGYNDAELRQIITDFQQVYRDRLSPDFSTEIRLSDGGALRITFPADIEPRFFCWLINYIQYPKAFDLKSRTILVAGRATVGSNFLPSDQSFIGKRVLFYVPTHDDHYDEVFAQVDGQSYKYPFSSEHWRRVQESRLPIGVSVMK